MADAPRIMTDADALAARIVADTGGDIRLALPLGLGKPVTLLNALKLLRPEPSSDDEEDDDEEEEEEEVEVEEEQLEEEEEVMVEAPPLSTKAKGKRPAASPKAKAAPARERKLFIVLIVYTECTVQYSTVCMYCIQYRVPGSIVLQKLPPVACWHHHPFYNTVALSYYGWTG